MTDEDRILDLLTERLERPLHDDERKRLDALLAQNPHWRRLDIDFAAAAAHVAFEPEIEEMPADVKERVLKTALANGPRAPNASITQSANVSGSTSTSGRSREKPRPARSLVVVVAPWLAAAAAVVVAVIGWTRPGASVDLASARAELLSRPGVVATAWTKTADPLGKNVEGDVVWSADKQTGFMRFHGVPANDVTKAQYQLWIFDGERDDRYPVDGGVFDISPNGDTIVAIHAKVPVGKATMFAVTLERPGGVVVSTRERLVALAKVT